MKLLVHNLQRPFSILKEKSFLNCYQQNNNTLEGSIMYLLYYIQFIELVKQSEKQKSSFHHLIDLPFNPQHSPQTTTKTPAVIWEILIIMAVRQD